jgi:hypothetical protein
MARDPEVDVHQLGNVSEAEWTHQVSRGAMRSGLKRDNAGQDMDAVLTHPERRGPKPGVCIAKCNDLVNHRSLSQCRWESTQE